ncbi:MAG: type II toxin-antitoxin system VapC family toxin [Actinomycetota bacterium]|jgi:uncharacterized protein|nr:type II toxin-antitoxin system VapC family toxin [Actinomycetota bacterium]
MGGAESRARRDSRRSKGLIVLDTSVLLYAVGGEHPLRQPSLRLVDAIGGGIVDARTTPEVLQEFVHVCGRRRPREVAAQHGRRYAELLAPLLVVTAADLGRGLRLYERHSGLGAFDAVLAATAIRTDANAIVSADKGFASVRGLVHVAPGTDAFERLLD